MRIARLAALAVVIHIVEASLPSPIPGIKPGLANVITIVVFLLYGWRDAVWVSLLRVLVASILAGTFLSPTFLLSLGGALSSLTVLGIIARLGGAGLGPVGVCVLASIAHISGQFFLAYVFFIPHSALLSLLPVLMTAALIFGIVSGIVSEKIVVSLRHST